MGEWLDHRRIELTSSDYATWLYPIAALTRLAPLLTEGEAKAEIYRRLSNGELLSAVRTSKWYDPRGFEEKKRAILGLKLWSFNGAPRDFDPLWKAASHNFQWTPSQHSSARFDVECFGIRFEPTGIDAILTDAGFTGAEEQILRPLAPETDEKRKTRHGLPALKDDLLRSWYELFLRAYPKGSKRLAETSARGMFPEHSVDRQKVRDLYGPGTMGRPLKENDK